MRANAIHVVTRSPSAELAPGTRVYCNEIGVLAPDLPADRYCYADQDCSSSQLEPFGRDRWWWK